MIHRDDLPETPEWSPEPHHCELLEFLPAFWRKTADVDEPHLVRGEN